MCAGDWSELPLEGPDELVYARLPGEDESFALPAGEEVGLLVRLTLEEAGEYEVLAELIGEQTVGTVYDADLRGVLVGPLTACTNPDDVYTLSYPAHWHTNEEALDEVPPCSLFDPVADQIRIDNDEVSTDVGVFLRVEDTDFAEVTGPAVGEEELAREDTTVDGQPAERIEVVATGEGFLPEGTLTTRWAVDLDGETFIAVSHDIGLPLFWQKVLVLDHMMDTITFGPVPS